ncbi:MAG: MraY family glycosyltransferase [Pseudomonadales bacterium]
MELIYSFTLALVLTIALTPLLIKFSTHLGLLDTPDEARKVHTKVMPRTGGLGIIFGALIPLFFLLPLSTQLLHLLYGCTIIVLFGLLDDRVQLSYKWKLFGQGCAAIVVISGGFTFTEIPLFGAYECPEWLAYGITFFFIVGIVNGVNFSDGMDGLAAGTTLLVLFLLAILAYHAGNATYTIISLTVAGGVLGFLRFNTFPAQLFMGDSGSQFLGFVTCCLAIGITQANTSAYSIALPLLLLGLPIMDILQVVVVRIVKRLPLPGPDKEHLHHQIARLGFEHYSVVAIIYIVQFTLLASAYFLRYENDSLIIAFFAAYFIAVVSAVFGMQAINWKWRHSSENAERERRNLFLRKLEGFYRHSPLVVEMLLVLFLLYSALSILEVPSSIAVGSLLLGVLMLVLTISRKNLPQLMARVWVYPSFAVVAYLLALGVAGPRVVMLANLLIAVLAVILVMAMRMSRRQDFSLNTMDLLIVLVVICLPLLPLDTISDVNARQGAMHLLVLLYASEFILTRKNQNARLLLLGAPIALFVVGIQGLI